MADFCSQCSKEIFGEDLGDLKGLITEEQVNRGLGAPALCEGCGITLVNHEGLCLGWCSNSTHKTKGTTP